MALTQIFETAKITSALTVLAPVVTASSFAPLCGRNGDVGANRECGAAVVHVFQKSTVCVEQFEIPIEVENVVLDSVDSKQRTCSRLQLISYVVKNSRTMACVSGLSKKLPRMGTGRDAVADFPLTMSPSPKEILGPTGC